MRNILCRGFRKKENKLTIGNCGSSRDSVAWAAREARVGVPPDTTGRQATREIRNARRSAKKAAGLNKFIS